ncbi:cory-CC-star protein [Serinicoccus marinus]|uniref:cory-CC-star protein n=1 Tax=Serinicoccus marinus TaxID=247333 RepID=UPI0003B600AF|nr:cory-CC-star protein [Serinicoccus marinus]
MSDGAQHPTPAGRLRTAAGVLRDVFSGPYARTFARAQQDEDDLFMVVVMAEALGVPNPASYYTVELLPVVYDQVHDWHRRMGLDRSPLDHFSCC